MPLQSELGLRSRWAYKACRKCGGDVYLESEKFGDGMYLDCLPCGANYELNSPEGRVILKILNSGRRRNPSGYTANPSLSK